MADPLPGHERYRGWITLPYLTPTGVIQIKARNPHPKPEDGGFYQKYVRLAGGIPKDDDEGDGCRALLYGVLAFQEDTDRIALCEGETDQLTLTECGIPAVGLPGVSQWRDEWSSAFSDYSEVVVVFDNDDAGEKGRSAVQNRLRRATMVRVPEPHNDITDMFLAEGREAVRERLGYDNG